VIGAQFNLADHHFSGNYTGATLGGTFSGFFTNPGGAPGSVPAGAGLTYSVSDVQNPLFQADGAAVFRKP
jgi:hypothetical protein